MVNGLFADTCTLETELARSTDRVANARRAKRGFDTCLIFALLPIWVPLCLLVAGLVLLFDGRPLIYRARRVGQGGQIFTLYKFRTMSSGPHGSPSRLSGGHTRARVSRLGGRLRRIRLDELPQLWNVLKGDMSLVGPRPPDPWHVTRNVAAFAAILAVRPGLTGLGSLHMHRAEDRVLAGCNSAREAEVVYASHCLPRKLRLERLYLARLRRPGYLWFDILILLRTCRKIFGKV